MCCAWITGRDLGLPVMTTADLAPDVMVHIKEAAQRLVQGRLVAFPTETVYGLGADAENPDAIARIYAAKGRPSNHPVIAHVAPVADIGYWAESVSPEAQALMDAFWPGPLTLILPRAARIPAQLSGGQSSIGIRCPSHPVAQALLSCFASLKGGHGALAAPSANKFGQVSPTTAAHVRSEFAELDEQALMILEGGASEVGIESTIVDLSRLDQGVGPVLLRPGHISSAQLAHVLGREVVSPDAQAPQVSGSLKAHYAPRTPLSLMSLEHILASVPIIPSDQRWAVYAFDVAPADLPGNVSWVAGPSDPEAYARDLYAILRRLDLQGYSRIVFQTAPSTPMWQAVNDRLGRAAAAFSD
jgi:L-threonylcarbamoyladenylate synthase